MMYCDVQTNEYYHRVIILYSNKRQKPQLSRDIYETDSIWGHNQIRHTTTENDNNGKGWYFRFDDDDNMVSYKYILSITKTWMRQFNTYSPTCFEENQEGYREN